MQDSNSSYVMANQQYEQGSRLCGRTVINPLKCSGIKWLHLKLFNAIQV